MATLSAPLCLRRGFFVLVFITILHVLWGAAALISPITVTTPMAFLLDLFGQRGTGVVLLTVAGLATVGISRPGWRGLLLGSFQNIALGLSASCAVVSIILGHYPDGTIRDSWFIFADQLPIIVLAVLHAISLGLYHDYPRFMACGKSER